MGGRVKQAPGLPKRFAFLWVPVSSRAHFQDPDAENEEDSLDFSIAGEGTVTSTEEAGRGVAVGPRVCLERVSVLSAPPPPFPPRPHADLGRKSGSASGGVSGARIASQLGSCFP